MLDPREFKDILEVTGLRFCTTGPPVINVCAMALREASEAGDLDSVECAAFL